MSNTFKVWVITWYDRKYGDYESTEYCLTQEEMIDSLISNVNNWGNEAPIVDVDMSGNEVHSIEVYGSAENDPTTYATAELFSFEIKERPVENRPYTSLLQSANSDGLARYIGEAICGNASEWQCWKNNCQKEVDNNQQSSSGSSTIVQHNIKWFLRNTGDTKAPSELDDASIEHIENMITQGYNQGELCVNPPLQVSGGFFMSFLCEHKLSNIEEFLNWIHQS